MVSFLTKFDTNCVASLLRYRQYGHDRRYRRVYLPILPSPYRSKTQSQNQDGEKEAQRNRQNDNACFVAVALLHLSPVYLAMAFLYAQWRKVNSRTL